MNPCNIAGCLNLRISQLVKLAASRLFVILAMTILGLSNVYALESDRDQSIEIESDRAEFRELEGLTVYSGNVRMSQGSILLLADEVSIHTENGTVSQLTATGERAYYEQRPGEGKEKIVAQGETIEYILADDVINIISNASLTQEGATLNGNLITYDVRNHLLSASNRNNTLLNGNEAQSNSDSSNTRVRVTIPSLDTRPALNSSTD